MTETSNYGGSPKHVLCRKYKKRFECTSSLIMTDVQSYMMALEKD